MRRVIYNTCIVDPWIEVAKKLYSEESFKPIYWIGYSYDDSRRVVPNTFSDIIYQSTEDAWKCVFPKDIDEMIPYMHLDLDFIRSVAPNELQAMLMMNRIDFSSYDFNFMERERHFIRLIKAWLAVIEKYKPDLVISAVFPHRVYDYVLYLLCKKMSIPFIMFQYSMVSGRIYCLDDFFTMSDMLVADYFRYCNAETKWSDIPEDILKSRERVLEANYKIVEPQYMKRNRSYDKEFSGIYAKVKRYIQKTHTAGGSIKWRNEKTCFKKRGVLLEENYQTLFGYWQSFRKAKHKKKELAHLYESLTTCYRDGDKYIYFPLHYQPENTTSPAGDIFANQYLCVDTVLKHTSSDMLIYVKEHPSQFMSQFLGQTSRIKEFYMDLIKNKRVRFMPLSEDPYKLMQNSVAVMTVTGTAGWEAMCNKKPVIMFGSVWYEKYEGVLRIIDEQSAATVSDFIKSFVYDEHKLQAYLLAFADNSIKAYHYRGYKKTANVSQRESVDNICKSILKKLSK